MWQNPVNSLLQRLNAILKITCSPVHTQKVYFLEILKIMGLTVLWCIFTNYWEVKSRKRQCMALTTVLKPKSKKKRWNREILVCLLLKNLQNLLRLERPQYWTPYSSFLSFSGKKTQQFLSRFPFAPSFLCKYKYYLNSVWVLTYFKAVHDVLTIVRVFWKTNQQKPVSETNSDLIKKHF